MAIDIDNSHLGKWHGRCSCKARDTQTRESPHDERPTAGDGGFNDGGCGFRMRGRRRWQRLERADRVRPSGRRADLFNLAATGQPNILVDLQSGWGSDTGSAFTTSSAAKIVVVADQAAQKWDYQSFGVWNDARLTGHQSIYSLSFGSATPAAGLPTAGSALFTGKLAGFYVAPGGQGSIATADLAVNANFSERSLSFSSSNSRITRDLAAA